MKGGGGWIIVPLLKYAPVCTVAINIDILPIIAGSRTLWFRAGVLQCALCLIEDYPGVYILNFSLRSLKGGEWCGILVKKEKVF